MLENIISNLIQKIDPLVEETKKQIKDVYLQDERPWVVGYSGGKDSTTVVQLIFEALSDLPSEQLHKKVYVISSDTLVETPLIIQSINTTLRRIQKEALKRNLPIETHKVKPILEDTFWANIIGKGYPTPNSRFRWCTDRLKISPANKFILDKASSFGEVIMVLGLRDKESATRANVMKSHTVDGKILMRHSTLTNAFVYAPIRRFGVDDVWNYLLNFECPWGDDNHALNKLYQDSNSGECPLVVDKVIKESAGSCGNSRFGCWVCTVVTKDKALNGFIQSGEDWMLPLLEFRNWLAEIRDVREMRMKYRKNGQIYFKEVNIENIDGTDYVIFPKKGSRRKQLIDLSKYKIIDKKQLKIYIEEQNIDLSSTDELCILVRLENGHLAQLGLGPFNLDARKEILRRLLITQRDLKHPFETNFKLIQDDELKIIRRYWIDDGDWEDSVPKIYKKIMGFDLKWEEDDRPLFGQDQVTDLELLSEEMKIDIKLVKQLISIERDYAGYKVRRGIAKNLDRILQQDYLHL